MKFIKSIIMCGVCMLALTSCSDWLDVNTDPNTPSVATAAYQDRLPWCEFYLNDAYQFAGSRSFFACGPLTATSRGSRDGASSQWQPTTSLVTTPYQWFFVGCGSNLNDLITTSEAAGAYHYAAAGHLLRAYGFMLMTDLYGEMPYTEALSNATLPKYDNGKTIFIGCLKEIDQAIEEFQKTQDVTAQPLSAGDSWNGGDVSKWLKMAYLLKARWINNLSKKQAGKYLEGKYDADEILSCLSKAQQSNADNTVINHTNDNSSTHDVLGWDEPIDYAPLHSVQGQSTANRVTKQLIDNLTNFAGLGVEDPRADHLIPWAYSRKSADTPAELKWVGNWRRSLGIDMHTNIRMQGAPYAQSYNSTTKSWYINSKAGTARLGDTVYVDMIAGSKFLGCTDLYYRRNAAVDESKVSGMFYNRPSSPGYVAMYHEACFIKAEVLFKKGDRSGAFDAYKAGIKASIDAMNSKLSDWVKEDGTLAQCPSFTPMTQTAIDNYLNNGIGTAGTLTLGMIMTQKQIAMFYSQQCWNDMRRYDYNPEIFLNWEIPYEYSSNATALKEIPLGQAWRRWCQCSHEKDYNTKNLQAIGAEVPGAQMTDASGKATNWFAADAVWSIPVWWDSTQE
jgi:hypothetical protein